MKVGVDADGREYQEKTVKKTGKVYRYYLDEGKIAEDYWTDIETLNREDKERLGYPTQKPERLLERIIKTSSNEGETVLDVYCGCGTTIEVAQRLKRRWIGMDITYQAISTVLNRLQDNFVDFDLKSVVLNGMPRDMESARRLANKQDDRLRKEFEKWAVLTYSQNRAIINEKKGADKGIDGIAFIRVGENETAKMILQVKSGQGRREHIATLRGDMSREKAELGVLITLENPSKNMLDEAKSDGSYRHNATGIKTPKIQIVTVQEMIENKKRLELPLNLEALRSALRNLDDKQLALPLKPAEPEKPPKKPSAFVKPRGTKAVRTGEKARASI